MRTHHIEEKNGLRSWLTFHLPLNVVCWIRGHTPRAVVKKWEYIEQESLWIDCRVCGLRNNDPFGTGKSDVPAGMSWREYSEDLTRRRLENLRRLGEREFLSGVDRRSGWSVREVTLHSQLVWPKKQPDGTRARGRRAVGFHLHLGNQHSETPIDANVQLGPLAAYVTVGGIGGRFAQLVGRGHKRDVMLEADRHTLRWRLWYDDDGGSDSYHRCDGRPRPKQWPWSAGRDKYRSWMCLRDGRLDVNPLDAFWGSRLFHYETIDTATAAVSVGEFSGDTYLADLELQRQTRHRDHGPAWARRSVVSYSVGWRVEGEGIPCRNHDWKGNGVIAAAESLPADFVPPVAGHARHLWAEPAVASLVERIKKDRVRYGYQPPAHRDFTET